MSCILLAAAMAILIPCTVLGQEMPRGEVYGTVGLSRVFRAEDESFGTRLGPGAGFEWRLHRRLGLGVEGSVVAGLEPRAENCSPPPGIMCTGSAREGVLEAAVMSVTAAYYFGQDPRTQLFVVGGIDVLRSRSVSSVTTTAVSGWTLAEMETRDTGIGPTAGAGVRIRLSPRVLLRPEFRLYDGAILGAANLAVMRTSVAVGYAW